MTNLTSIYLEAKVIEFQDHKKYRWASGMMSPVYCDHRKMIGNVKCRKALMSQMIEACRKNLNDIDAVVGVATGGIAYAAWVADALDLPMGYVRTQSKDHGKPNRVEGGLSSGARVLLIEDMISTGGSSLEVVKTLKNEGFGVPHVQCLMTYFPQFVVEKFAAEGAKMSFLVEFRNFVSEPSVQAIIEKCPELYAQWESDLTERCQHPEKFYTPQGQAKPAFSKPVIKLKS